MYIILEERETNRIGIDNMCLQDQNDTFGVSFWGFYDRHFDTTTKRHYSRWGYKVFNKHVLMLSIIKYGIKVDLFLNENCSM